MFNIIMSQFFTTLKSFSQGLTSSTISYFRERNVYVDYLVKHEVGNDADYRSFMEPVKITTYMLADASKTLFLK